VLGRVHNRVLNDSPACSIRVTLDLGFSRLQDEARYWAEVDSERLRSRAWSSIACLGTMVLQEMTRDEIYDVNQLVAETMQAPQCEGL
jgi:hypothetical protein